MGADTAASRRTTATVVFTDLVGSTELRSRLGEDAADALRRRHDRLLNRAVEAHHGQVVKGLGDGIMASFSAASDAVAAAVSIQQSIERYNRSGDASARLAVRIGLSAGDVIFEQGDCFGTPVVEAARLCAVAAGGQIVVSEMVGWLVRGGDHQFLSLGDLDLKGLPGPVPACQVVWAPPTGAAVPLPPLLTEVGRIFVGRDDELDRLGQLWKEAAAGERRVGFVAGEPGVGKTRLAAEVARQVFDEGATVLAGRCDEDLGVPFQPFVEALRHLVDQVPADELDGRLGRYAGELERLLPGLRDRLTGVPPPLQSDPDTERYRLFEAVTAWLAASSQSEPLLLILDDLQWAAKPTLLLLRHVVQSSEPIRLLIVGTYRDTELHHDHPLVELLADLRRQGGIERLSLSGFDEANVADFVAQAAGHDLNDDDLGLVRVIHAETGGNPFFVRETLRHLRETEAIVERDGRMVTRRAVEDLGIPEGVREVVGRRVSRLSNDAHPVLRVAAVVGAEFEALVVGRAAGFDDDRVLSTLEEAIAARLVVEIPAASPRYRFAHALVRDTLYDQLSAARRVALHRRVAEVIEALHGDDLDDHLPALAHHWARGAAPAAEMTRAAGYAARAGHRALAQLAHDEAAAYYRQALELRELAGAPADREHCELLISLGEAQRRAGEPRHRDTLLAAGRLAEKLGEFHLLARAALTNRRGLFSPLGAVDWDRAEAMETALDAVGPSDSPERARLLAALATELHLAPDRSPAELARGGLAVARRLAAPSTLAEAIEAVWLAVRDPAAIDERRMLAAELTDVVGQIGDPVFEFRAAFVRFLTASEQGDVPAMEQAVDVCRRLAEEVGQPLLRWRAAFLRTHQAFMNGDLDEAERRAEEALRIGRSAGAPDAAGFSDVYLVRILQGRVADAVEMIGSVDASIKSLEVFPALEAWAWAEAGRRQQADACMARAWEAMGRHGHHNYLWLATEAMLARACACLGDTAGATELYRRLRPHRGTIVIGQAVWFGPVDYELGLLATVLGNYADADRHFNEAVERHARMGVRGMLAHTYLAWARVLALRAEPRDKDRARGHLRRAQETARELGIGNVEEQAVTLAEKLS